MNLRSFPAERQLDMMDCGPACLKMIAKHYGKFYSLQYLRDKCGVTEEGVSFDDISHATEAIGLRTLSIKCTIQVLLNKMPLPVIAHWNSSHFVVVTYNIKQSGSNSTIYISDPALGHVKYDVRKFTSKWIKVDTNNEILMAVEPQAEFYEKK